MRALIRRLPSSVIHAFIVLQTVLPYPLGGVQLNAVCPDCHRDWRHGGGGKHRDGATYALLSDQDDVEAQTGTSISVNDGEATPRSQRESSAEA